MALWDNLIHEDDYQSEIDEAHNDIQRGLKDLKDALNELDELGMVVVVIDNDIYIKA